MRGNALKRLETRQRRVSLAGFPAEFFAGGIVEIETPESRFFGSLGVWAQVAERLMAADCKSAAPWSYGGSNPPLCTMSSVVSGQ